MKLKIKIRDLHFDTETGRFEAAAEVITPGEQMQAYHATGSGVTHPEAISVAISNALRGRALHKGAT